VLSAGEARVGRAEESLVFVHVSGCVYFVVMSGCRDPPRMDTESRRSGEVRWIERLSSRLHQSLRRVLPFSSKAEALSPVHVSPTAHLDSHQQIRSTPSKIISYHLQPAGCMKPYAVILLAFSARLPLDFFSVCSFSVCRLQKVGRIAASN
jgi:hypothetical protein